MQQLMKYWYFFVVLTGLFGLSSCGSEPEKGEEKLVLVPEKNYHIAPDYRSTTVQLPEGFSYDVLFQSGDSVSYLDAKGIAKNNLDLIVFVPTEDPEKGLLYVSHETHGVNLQLGDGGGATVLNLEKNDGKWSVEGDARNVDFRHVGYTESNCGGKISCNNTVLTAEEHAPKSNEEIQESFSDLDPVNGLEKWQNFGYTVEVDARKAKAMHKLVSMGRYKHEDAICMGDGRTFYLTNDDNPAVFFKYVADSPEDYTSGVLHAFKQTEEGGEWLALPRDTATMIRAKEAAIELGATLFQRHEWVTQVGNSLYITETGADEFNWTKHIASGGTPATHFENLRVNDTLYDDPYGRILKFDLETQQMSVLLEGGSDKTGVTNLANPDCINHVVINGKEHLIISEDVYVGTKNRMNAEASEEGFHVCEIYLLDLSIENPTVEDLKRFLVAPHGAETTGIYFSPDRKTMFLNIQHPSETNPAPFNKSTTIAITGF